jgi:hypothetical protein
MNKQAKVDAVAKDLVNRARTNPAVADWIETVLSGGFAIPRRWSNAELDDYIFKHDVTVVDTQ